MMLQKILRLRTACPNAERHTPCPDGYLQWHAWAKQKSKTHRQVKCSGCDRYAIWIPKRKQRQAQGEGDV